MHKAQTLNQLKLLGKLGHRDKYQLCSAAPSLLFTSDSLSLCAALLLISGQDAQSAETDPTYPMDTRASSAIWVSGVNLSPSPWYLSHCNSAWVTPGQFWHKWVVNHALVLCPLCLTHTCGFLSWEKDNGLAFFLPLQYRKGNQAWSNSQWPIRVFSWQCNHGYGLVHT